MGNDRVMTAPLISLLMPTRGRRAMAERFFRSIAENTAYPEDVELIVYADDDDVDSHSLGSPVFRVERIIGPRLTMGEYNSLCMERAGGDIIILVNDDIVIRTPGWDETVRELDRKYTDKVYLGYANDLIQGSKLCTFPILSRRTCEILVDPYPSAYRGEFIDTHVLDVFKRLQYRGHDRIEYLADVVFEHMHFGVGKAAKDDTYTKRVSYNDAPRFLGLRGRRQEAADRLMGAIRGERPPAYSERVVAEPWPDGLLGAVIMFSRIFLLDWGLPVRWRLSLWMVFFRYFVVSKGYLRRFNRSVAKGSTSG